jgi:hypothetical protein
MATYRVAFDGKWQQDFEDQEEALAWAREVGDTGRMVHVARKRLVKDLELVAVFPDSQAEEGRELWRTRLRGYLGSGSMV